MEAWLARAARLRGERTALQTESSRLTYAGLFTRAQSVAGALLERGVRPGDRVALAMPSEQLVVALHGCLLIGAVAVPVDLRLRERERALRLEAAALVLSELPDGPADGRVDGPADGRVDGPAAGRVDGPAVEPVEVDGSATATLMFTSGTTAGPKPVALSYDNWLWNAIGSALALGLDPAERWLCPMPLAHVGGLSIQLRSAIYGTTVVLHERFDTGRALAALMDPGERVTLVSLVPTMLARLLDAGLREPPALRRVLLGGGPMAPALLRRAAEAGVAVSPSYGMTETCSQIATDGVPLLGTELRIAGSPPAGMSEGAGPGGGEPVLGEVLVRGRTVSAGAVGPDGWLHTGDLGHFDEAGRLVIAGRKADTIVTGGENVAPAEVEAVLLEHPAVADAAVFGRADEEWGEAVIAHVVLSNGTAVTPDELRAHCAGRLAPFKVPKRVEVVESVPRGVTGKLLRRELA